MPSSYTTRDDEILGSVEHAAQMMRNIAHQYASDYDDLYQVAAETALKVYDRAQQARDPVGYIHRSIRNAILNYIGATSPDHRVRTFADFYRVSSLDASLTHDPGFSLYDVVAVSSPDEEEDRDFSCLYTVLDSLPDAYREVVFMRFGLCGYAPQSFSEIARTLGIPYNTVKTHFRRVLAMLREYTELLDLVERHKPPEE